MPNTPSYVSNLTAALQHTLPNATLSLTHLPKVPEIQLYLLDEQFDSRALSLKDQQRIMQQPEYWIFCWASGLVLARWLLDNPQVVHNKTVMDFGCGSGVVAIAASMAGAKHVIACDTDKNALMASRINADVNKTTLHYSPDFNQVTEHVDVILAADVLYDRANLVWLPMFLDNANTVIIADSRIKNFNRPPFLNIGQHNSHTVPDLAESEEFNRVNLYSNKNLGLS